MITNTDIAIRLLYRAIRLSCNEETIKKIMVSFVESYIDEGLSVQDGKQLLEQYGIFECLGCLEKQPNQLAHMDPSGCLYVGNGC
jgi:hypothetical protein